MSSALPGASPGVIRSAMQSRTCLKAATRLSSSSFLGAILMSFMRSGSLMRLISERHARVIHCCCIFFRLCFLLQCSRTFISLTIRKGTMSVFQMVEFVEHGVE